MAAKLVVDASVVIASLLPDEPYRDAALGLLARFLADDLDLITTSLLRYEVANALWRAVRTGRVKLEDAEVALKTLENFNIAEREVAGIEALRFAHRYDRSAYDAAYLALAHAEGAPLITADRRLYNALRDRFGLLVWVGDRS